MLSPYNAIAAEVNTPDVGGAGIGSMVDFIINGDTLMSDYGSVRSLGNALASFGFMSSERPGLEQQILHPYPSVQLVELLVIMVLIERIFIHQARLLREEGSVEYLVVAGGGGGGAQGAGSGGGGAGGLRANLPGVQDAAGHPLAGAALPVSTGATYTVTVGAGGDARRLEQHMVIMDSTGSDSVFWTTFDTKWDYCDRRRWWWSNKWR